jgi:hypothetical protein
VDLPEWLTPHTVEARTYTGSGVAGPVHGDPVESRAMVEYRRRMVRTADKTNVLSAATVYLPLDAPELPPLSLVTLPAETTPRQVVACTRHEFDESTPNHWEVTLQ